MEDNVTDESEDFVEEAKTVLALRAPLAPYWEGRTFDDALTVSVCQLRSEAERAALYERLLALLDTEKWQIREQALSHLYHSFTAEESEENDEEQPADRIALLTRMESMLAGVERLLDAHPDLLQPFCHQFSPNLMDPPQIASICAWLNRLEASGSARSVPAHTLLAMRIVYGAFGSTWREAGERLLATLDHDDLLVRACAAYQIGTFCSRLLPKDRLRDFSNRDYEGDRRATEGMAPMIDYWTMIQKKEIVRPGLAGAFWSGAPTDSMGSDFGDEWILTLIEQAEQEPYLPFFPCNIGFEAHERFSRNPKAVRRLIDAERFGLAAEAASDWHEPVEGMEPLLMELGENDDPEVVRLASWTLGYYYNRLHPNGERLGYVQHYAGFADCDMYLLFSKHEESDTPYREPPGTPYAVVLYPKPPKVHWSQAKATALVDRLFPPSVRGDVRIEDYPFPGTIRYLRGFVDFAGTNTKPRSGKVVRIMIGYRCNTYWNPLPV